MKKTAFKYTVSFVIGAAIAILVMNMRGIFALTDFKDIMRILSDSFFVSGVCLSSAGLILFVSNDGLFDIFGFSIQLLFGALKRNVRERKYKDFYEYKEKREKKRHSVAYLLIVGIFFIVAAVVFLFLFYSK